MFLAGKLVFYFADFVHRPEHVRPDLEATLRDLQLDYVDSFLIHWAPAAPSTGTVRLLPVQVRQDCSQYRYSEVAPSPGTARLLSVQVQRGCSQYRYSKARSTGTARLR